MRWGTPARRSPACRSRAADCPEAWIASRAVAQLAQAFAGEPDVVEGDGGLAGEAMSDDRSHEGRAATDSAHGEQEAPARAAKVTLVVDVARKGGDDAEALGGVVQSEADDQQQCQGQLPAGR